MTDSRIRQFRPGDEEQVMALLNEYCERYELAHWWELEDVKWHFNHKIVHSFVFEENGTIKGIASCGVFPYNIRKGDLIQLTTVAQLEHCHFHNLTTRERRDLLRALLHYLKKMDVDPPVGAIAYWGFPYLEIDALKKNRFFKMKRPIMLWLRPINETLKKKYPLEDVKNWKTNLVIR